MHLPPAAALPISVALRRSAAPSRTGNSILVGTATCLGVVQAPPPSSSPVPLPSRPGTSTVPRSSSKKAKTMTCASTACSSSRRRCSSARCFSAWQPRRSRGGRLQVTRNLSSNCCVCRCAPLPRGAGSLAPLPAHAQAQSGVSINRASDFV